MSLLTGSVPLSRHYHPIVQLSEDNLEWSLSSGAPVITGGWTVQEVELLLSWGLQETDIAQATFSAVPVSPQPLAWLSQVFQNRVLSISERKAINPHIRNRLNYIQLHPILRTTRLEMKCTKKIMM